MISMRIYDRTIGANRYLTTGTNSVAEAREVAVEMDRKLRQESGLPLPSRQEAKPPEVPKIGDAIADAINKSGALDNTKNQYRSAAKKFKEWAKKKRLGLRRYTDLTFDIVEQYRDELIAKGYAYDTIRSRIAVLRLTGNYMIRFGHPNPTAGLKLKRECPVSIRNWSGEQLIAFLQWCKENNGRFYVARLLQGLCGLRLYEAAYLRDCDIDFVNKTIAITKTPHHKPKNLASYRTLPVGDFVLKELREHLSGRSGTKHEGCLLVDEDGKPWQTRKLAYESGRDMTAYMSNHAPEGTPYISSKDLRKTFTTLLEVNLKANPTALGFYLGHSDGSIRHTHYTAKDIEFMREEIAGKVDSFAVKNLRFTPVTITDM